MASWAAHFTAGWEGWVVASGSARLAAGCLHAPAHRTESRDVCSGEGRPGGRCHLQCCGRQTAQHAQLQSTGRDEPCELWAAVHALNARWPHALRQRLTALSASARKPVEAVEAQHVSQPRLLCMLAHVLLDLIYAWHSCQAWTPSILALTQKPYLWAEEP